jgi:hypothetical protein
MHLLVLYELFTLPCSTVCFYETELRKVILCASPLTQYFPVNIFIMRGPVSAIHFNITPCFSCGFSKLSVTSVCSILRFALIPVFLGHIRIPSHQYGQFEVRIAVTIKSNVLWDPTSCKRTDICCHFRRTCFSIISPKY